MSFKAFLTTVEKDAEIAVEDVLKVLGKVQSEAPGAAAALGAVAAAVSTALNDAEAAKANPTSLILNFGADIADIKAVWPSVVTFLASVGITVK